MGLGNAIKLTHDEGRNHGPVVRELVLPPANSQVAPEGFSVVEIGADDRSFKIQAGFHRSVLHLVGPGRPGIYCLVRRLQMDYSPLKVEGHAKMAQEVSAQVTPLPESSRYVYRLEVQHRRVNFFTGRS